MNIVGDCDVGQDNLMLNELIETMDFWKGMHK